jgi:hypothetical protein
MHEDYIIRVVGCDDFTAVLMSLDSDAVSIAQRIAETVNAQSESSCEPRMRVERYADAPPYVRERVGMRL